MPSISVTKVDPKTYGYDSYYIALKYTLSGAGRLHSISAYRKDAVVSLDGSSTTTYVYTPIDIVDTYSTGDLTSGAVAIIFDKDNNMYRDEYCLQYDDDGCSIKSNIVFAIVPQLSISPESDGIVEIGTNYELPISINIPSGYKYTDGQMHLVITKSGNTIKESYFNLNQSAPTTNVNNVVKVVFDENSLTQLGVSESNKITNVDIRLFPYYHLIQDNYSTSFHSRNVALDFTSLYNSKPPSFNFNIKNENTKVKTLFGADNIIPYGYISLYAYYTRVSISSGTINDYQIKWQDNLSFVDINTAYTSGKQLLDFSLSPGIYQPKMRGVYSYTANGVRKYVYGDVSDCSNLITVLPYTKPTFSNVTCNRLNGFENETTVNFTVTCSSLYHNNRKYNSINTVKYRVKTIDDAAYSGYVTTNITTTQTGSNNNNTIYNCSFKISLLKENSYDIELYVDDKLESNTYVASLGQGIPLFCQSENGYMSIGKIPDFENYSDCKLQVCTDILVDDVDKSVRLLNAIKNSIVCSDIEPISQLIGGLWLCSEGEAEQLWFTFFSCGDTRLYYRNCENAVPYNSGYWRIIDYKGIGELQEDGGIIYSDYYPSVNDMNNATKLFTLPSGEKKYGCECVNTDGYGLCLDNFPFESGTRYRVSFFARYSTVYPSTGTIGCYILNYTFLAYPYEEVDGKATKIGTLTSSWKEYSIEFTCTNVNKSSVYFYFKNETASSSGFVDFCNMKIQKK